MEPCRAQSDHGGSLLHPQSLLGGCSLRLPPGQRHIDPHRAADYLLYQL